MSDSIPKPVGAVHVTDFERIFCLIKHCRSVYTLTDLPNNWHRMTVTFSPTNAGRCLLDGQSFLFTPDGVLAGCGPVMKGEE